MTSSLLQPPLPKSAKVRRYWENPPGSSLALVLEQTGRNHAGLVVAVTSNISHAGTSSLAVKIAEIYAQQGKSPASR